jgi:hypothetical protein
MVGREKFVEPKNLLSPPAITAWEAGLNNVTLRDEPIHKKQAAGKYEAYVFPDPRWFLNATESRCARLLKNWLKSRQTWIWRASHSQSGVPTMSITLWKEALHLGFGSGAKVTLTSSKGQHIKKMLEHFGCTLSPDGSLQLPSAGLPGETVTQGEPIWKQKTIACTDSELPKDSVVTEVMWELYELNFRFDLLMLDQILTGSLRWSVEKRLERQRKVERCFYEGDGVHYLLAHPVVPAINTGLASDSTEVRHTYVVKLARLILDWNTPIPTTISSLVNKTLGLTDMRNFEVAVAEFYCQTFYNKIGRAPLTPHHIVAPTHY